MKRSWNSKFDKLLLCKVFNVCMNMRQTLRYQIEHTIMVNNNISYTFLQKQLFNWNHLIFHNMNDVKPPWWIYWVKTPVLMRYLSSSYIDLVTKWEIMPRSFTKSFKILRDKHCLPSSLGNADKFVVDFYILVTNFNYSLYNDKVSFISFKQFQSSDNFKGLFVPKSIPIQYLQLIQTTQCWFCRWRNL